MEVKLEAIKFNHQENSASNDGFSIRVNENLLVPSPEWPPTNQVTNSPAAYASDLIGNNAVIVMAKFSCDDLSIKEVSVRARDASTGPTPNVLGTVPATKVALHHPPDFVPLILSDVRIGSAGVSASDVIWRWQFSVTPEVENSWTDMNTAAGNNPTVHRIYTVFSEPTDPWEPRALPASNSIHIPWTEVLEKACEWAPGARNEVEAATAITQQMFKLGSDGKVHYTRGAIYARLTFNCTAFLSLLNTNKQTPPRVNCDDCATVVSTFTNILGGDLWQSEMGYIFGTNQVEKIGASRFGPTRFPRHAVAWKYPCNKKSPLYDACLELDKLGGLIGTPVPLLATNIVFEDPQRDPEYKFCLVHFAVGDHCDPKPDSKIRRKLGTSYLASRRFVDNDFLAPLKKHYGFESWPTPQGFEPVRDLSIKDLLESSSIFDAWQKNPIIEFVGFLPDEGLAAASSILLFRSSNTSLEMIEINLYQSDPPETANEFLLQLLAQFERTDFERQVENHLGDVSFTAPEKTEMIFRRGQFSSVVRSVGRDNVSSLEIAGAVDDYFKTLYQPPVE